MTSLTHGADAGRLREIASTMRGEGARVQEVGDQLGPLSGMLQEAWGGPDAEHLLSQVEMLRPSIATTGATLIAWAEDLRGQADQQTAGSGEVGGAGGSLTRGDVTDGVRKFAGLTGKLSAPTSGGPGSGWPGGGALSNAIGDGPQTDPGQISQPGWVSNSDEAKLGPDNGFKAKVTATETVGVSKESVDSEGRSVQTTTVTGTVEGTVGASGDDKKGTGGSFSVGGGTEVSYSVTVPVGVDPTTIDPLDPGSWPPGTSVRFTEEFYVALDAGVSFRGLMTEAGYDAGERGYVEVSKGDGDQVVVLVGDEEFARASQSVGLGTSDLNVKAGASSGFSHGTAHEVTLDLGTEQGRQAYRDLVAGGAPPTAGDPGVVDVADLTVFDASKSIDISGTAGDVSAGGNLSEWKAGGVQRVHADGTTTLEWTGTQSGIDVSGVARFDTDGNPILTESTYQFRLEGVSPEDAQLYNDAYLGENVTPTADNNVVLDLTNGDLRRMKTQAATTTAEMINANPDAYPDFPGAGEGPVTSADVLNHCRDNPDAATDLGGSWTATQQILTAQSDQEILRTMMATGGPLEFQRELGVDYYSATGERITPVGEVTSRRSA